MPSNLLINAFDDRSEAELAVDELKQAGFPHDRIGMALRGDDVDAGGMLHDAEGAKDKQGAAKGIFTGSVIGGVLGGATALIVPGGAGAILIGEMLAGLAGGAAAGAATGGIYGALSGLGVSEEEAHRYQHEFNSGRAIVTVRADDRLDEAERILHKHGGYRPAPAS